MITKNVNADEVGKIFSIVGTFQVSWRRWHSVWLDWAIFCCLGDFLKPVVGNDYFAQIAHIIGLFWKSVIFLLKAFLGKFL